MEFALDIYSIVFYLITLLWILEFVFFPSKKESGGETKSFYVITGCIVTIISLTIISYRLNLLLISNGVLPIYLRTSALITYFIGIVLKYWSSICLGEYFNRNVVVKKDQELVSNGPYGKLRHPLYLSLFMLTISVPLFYQNILLFCFSVIVMGYVLNNRMKIEEQIMEDVIGKPYTNWKSTRYRFLPFLY